MSEAKLHPGLLLDRDGVINVDHGYVHEWSRFEFVPGIERLIAAARRAGWRVAIVTNQSGIARGMYTEAQMHALHAQLRRHLSDDGSERTSWIEAIYHCPYLPGAAVPRYDLDSPLRKPRPGMLLQAIADLSLDRTRTVMIGDSSTDIQAAEAAGVAGLLFTEADVWTFASRLLPELASEIGADPAGQTAR